VPRENIHSKSQNICLRRIYDMHFRIPE